VLGDWQVDASVTRSRGCKWATRASKIGYWLATNNKPDVLLMSGSFFQKRTLEVLNKLGTSILGRLGGSPSSDAEMGRFEALVRS
jgi:hypothetical protein